MKDKPIFQSEEIIKILEGSMFLVGKAYPDREETSQIINNLSKAISQLSEIRISETKGEL